MTLSVDFTTTTVSAPAPDMCCCTRAYNWIFELLSSTWEWIRSCMWSCGQDNSPVTCPDLRRELEGRHPNSTILYSYHLDDISRALQDRLRLSRENADREAGRIRRRMVSELQHWHGNLVVNAQIACIINDQGVQIVTPEVDRPTYYTNLIAMECPFWNTTPRVGMQFVPFAIRGLLPRMAFTFLRPEFFEAHTIALREYLTEMGVPSTSAEALYCHMWRVSVELARGAGLHPPIGCMVSLEGGVRTVYIVTTFSEAVQNAGTYFRDATRYQAPDNNRVYLRYVWNGER